MQPTIQVLACAMLLATSACLDREQAAKAIEAVQTDGAKPVSFLNAALNVDLLLKPAANASSSRGRWVGPDSRRTRCTSATRRPLT